MSLYDEETKGSRLINKKVEEGKGQAAKRVNIVSVKLVKESRLLYMKRSIHSPEDAYELIHFHPSGHCTPSREDIEVTKRLKQAGELIGIELLDHLIVGDDRFLSLKQEGHL